MDIGEKPYDCSEKDNVSAFKRLPSSLQLFIKQTQNKISQMVKIHNPGRKLVRTSGWRSFKVNSRCGGVSDSLHLFGMATDYRRIPGEPPLVVGIGFVCLASGSKENPVWHVMYKRGI